MVALELKMTSPTGSRRSEQGGPGLQGAFTLVELLLVMTILVTVIAVAAPSLAHFFRGRTLDSEARRMLALTRLGQSRAISEGFPMVLWVDVRQRTYGLEMEAGFTERDTKAVEYRLSEDVQAQIMNNNASRRGSLNGAMNGVRSAATPVVSVIAEGRAKQALARSVRRNLPRIRFDPDGTLNDPNAPLVRLTDREGGELWLAPSPLRLDYEIRSQINPGDEVLR